MKKEEIEAKLKKLFALYEQLKSLRSSQGEDFSLEDEDLLSQAELLEEALKNYMYRFGFSIYRNKKRKRFFKKFIHDEDEVRGFDELEPQCFELVEAHQNFLQRFFEYMPVDRLTMLDSIEGTVYTLYSADPQMVEIFDELVNEESSRCIAAIYGDKADARAGDALALQNIPQKNIEIDAPDINVKDIEAGIKPALSTINAKRKMPSTPKAVNKQRYDCGRSSASPKSVGSSGKKINSGSSNER